MHNLILQIPSLRTIDFKRIKDAERASSLSLFLDSETSLPTKLALQLMSESNSSSTNGLSSTRSKQTTLTNGKGEGGGAGGKGRLMSEEEKKKVKEAIMSAKSVEEMRRLERMLSEGRVPEGGTGV